MRREELLKSDLLSDIVLVGSGIVLFMPLLLIVLIALTQTPR
ncbi:MAG TPA: hypothetical protein VFB28_10265 [Terriglobales bacterium]|jgi:lipopolysaccharide/colanic/teichoic acid biosynthesis glycosyltransferase|nr:hypothetical protein [Terriglobales bacterium]